ncbi:MAG: hypothetical protein U0Q16_39640, partial [Bryobacteraceae bacterium]
GHVGPVEWFPIRGRFDTSSSTIRFEPEEKPDGKMTIGICLSNRSFSGGRIRTAVSVDGPGAAEILFFYSPVTRERLTAGIGGSGNLFAIRHHWYGEDEKLNSDELASGGNKKNLRPGAEYKLELALTGGSARLIVNGVEACSATLPFQPPSSQVGVYCSSAHAVAFRDFSVETEKPVAFVVMQFTPEYDQLFHDVIRPVCAESGLVAVRADETPGPGMIIADITKQIVDSKVVIADITPRNPNVYYEVGYAHALKKPTILIAERNETKLPFDVSAFRTLFYENSIGGKKKIEDGLRKYLTAIG